MNGARADLWILPIDAPPADRVATLLRMLSADERTRAARFVFPGDAAIFVLSHALVRTVLSRYAAVAPAGWSFTANAHGRPEVADPRYAFLRFNLSHTDGCAVVAVTRDRAIGVDVEALGRHPVSLDVADRYFAPPERDDLRRAPPADTHRVFLEIWTLKEAYIKARGVGLSLGLHDFICTRGDTGVARVAFTPRLDDHPEAWHLEQFTPLPAHVGAVAVARTPGERIMLHTHHLTLEELQRT